MAVPVSEEDIVTVERCARAIGATLEDWQWTEIWRLLRDGASPYTVLAEIGLTDIRSD
jgi:hypothetical protein